MLGPLGAPSLPKITSIPTSPDSNEAAPAARARAPRETTASRTIGRSAEPPPPVPDRVPRSRASRTGHAPVPVAGRPSGSPPVQIRRAVVDRIAEAAVPLRAGQTTRLCLSLHPDPLGELVIELSMSGGALRGVVRTESEAARALISADLSRLRSDLERRGLRIASLQVVVTGNEPGPELALPSWGRCHLVDIWA